MKIVVDSNLPLTKEAFSSFGEVVALGTDQISSRTVRDADVLIVRSETTVDRSLLDGSRIQFVGTGTIGADHVDTAYLEYRGIGFASAPGCNANAVKEYVVAALLYISQARGFGLYGRTLGVVGVGNVGRRVVQAAEALGLRVLQNDPPLARQTGEKRFVSLDALMEADIITLHVPLNRSGPDPTYHLFGRERLGKLKAGTIFLNTSRGAVIDTSSLKESIREERISDAVIDVWEGEPLIDMEALSMVTLGTPHIAGHSVEGKVNAVRMIREAMCRYFSVKSDWDSGGLLGPPDIADLVIPDRFVGREAALHHIVSQCYDITIDDASLRRMLSAAPADRGIYFRGLRARYRPRREFSNVRVHLQRDNASLAEVVEALGFRPAVLK